MSAPSPDTFLASLRDAQLLDPSQVEELAGLPEAHSTDVRPLARLAVQRGWLTRYQAKMVAQGRGKELHVGPYVVLDHVGEGGMGEVYKARHRHMNRIAALKFIRKERLDRPEAVKRFYQEAEAGAQLHHPNIVLSYDAGPSGQTHFLAMEYVEGVDLGRLVRQKGPLPYPDACDYIRQAALGLQHAHERGTIHRDIKPSNLILSQSADGSGSVVKVMDMGLARVARGEEDRQEGVTRDGVVLGTPEFLAPEQARDARSADARSDLYSLGCSLHLLLTTHPPFRGGSLTELLLKHQTEPPPTLAEHGAKVPEGVQEIVHRLLAKKPEDRFATARDLAEALRPFCANAQEANDPALRPAPDPPRPETDWSMIAFDDDGDLAKPSPGTLLTTRRKLDPQEAETRRRRIRVWGIVGVALHIMAMFLVGTVVYVKWFRVPPQDPSSGEFPTVIAPPVGSTERLVVDLGSGTRPGDTGRASPPIVTTPIEPPIGPSPPAAPLAEFEIRRIANGLGLLTAMALSADGRLVATASAMTPGVRVWEVETGRPTTTFSGHGGTVSAITFMPDGKRALSAGLDKTVRLWNLSDGEQTRTYVGMETSANAVVVSPNGRFVIASGGALKYVDGKQVIEGGRVVYHDCIVHIWDLESGQSLGRLDGHGLPVRGLSVSSDSRRLLSTSDDATCKEWDLTTRRERSTLSVGRIGAVRHAVLVGDGTRALVNGGNLLLRLVEVMSQQEVRSYPEAASPPHTVVVSNDGRLALTGHGSYASPGPGQPARKIDCLMRLWDIDKGQETARLDGHTDLIRHVAFLPDNRRAISGSSDGTLRLWDLTRAQAAAAVRNPPPKPVVPTKPVVPPVLGRFEGHRGLVPVLAFSPDGKRLLSGGSDRTVRLWQVESGKEIKEVGRLFAPAAALVFGAGERAVAVDENDTCQTWEIDTGRGLPPFASGTKGVRTLSPDGAYFVLASPDVIDAWGTGDKAGRSLHVRGKWSAPQAVAVGGATENLTVAFATDGSIHLGSLISQKWVRSFRGPKARVLAMAFSPKLLTSLLVAAEDRSLTLYGLADGRPLKTLPTLKEKATCLTISPDGKRALTGGADGVVRLWDLTAAKEIKQFAELEGEVRAVAFSPDGKRIAACGSALRVWTP